MYKGNTAKLSAYIYLDRTNKKILVDTSIVNQLAPSGGPFIIPLEFYTTDIFGRSSAPYEFSMTV